MKTLIFPDASGLVRTEYFATKHRHAIWCMQVADSKGPNEEVAFSSFPFSIPGAQTCVFKKTKKKWLEEGLTSFNALIEEEDKLKPGGVSWQVVSSPE